MSKKATIGRWKKTGRMLGSGGQGQILVVEDVTGEHKGDYALKLVMNELRKDRIDLEISTTKSLYRTGAPVLEIIDDYTVSQPTANRPWYVSPVVPGGSLKARLSPGNCFGDSELESLRFFKQFVAAVKQIHERGVAHRDLKPANVLLGTENKVILCDLGLCLPLQSQMEVERLTGILERIGSVHYTPPEAYGGRQPVEKQQYPYDIYATGKILYELLAGIVLPGFRDPNDPEFDLAQKRSGYFYPLLNSLLRGLLSVEPDRRLTTWQKIEEHLEALEESLQPEHISNLAQFRATLATASDSVARTEKTRSLEEVKGNADAQSKCLEIANEVGRYWKDGPRIKILCEEWVPSNPHIAESQITIGTADVLHLLRGPYVVSNRGLEPLEDRGWNTSTATKSGTIIGLKFRGELGGKIPNLWLTLMASYQGGEMLVAMMIIEQIPGQRQPIDILDETISIISGDLDDPSLMLSVRKEAGTLAGQWVDMVMKGLE